MGASRRRDLRLSFDPRGRSSLFVDVGLLLLEEMVLENSGLLHGFRVGFVVGFWVLGGM